MNQRIIEWVVNFPPLENFPERLIDSGADHPNQGSSPKVNICGGARNWYEASKDTATELMDVVVLFQLRLCHLLMVCLVIPLVQEKYLAPGGSWSYYCVHYDDVWLHYIIGQLSWSSIHKKSWYQNYEGTRNQKTYVLICKLSNLIFLVHFEYLVDLWAWKFIKLWVLFFKFFCICLSYLP